MAADRLDFLPKVGGLVNGTRTDSDREVEEDEARRIGLGPRSISHVNVSWKHHKKNLGALLTDWDRLFGTYYNPDDVTGELKFGLRERVNPVRLVIGV